ncbi:MAG TPA: MliC family protein [Povalibacter sp.]|uniref:MliC family protein n=1 Tax=Povalibacter sp. TaxID=1962978 RepID=UPI002C7438AD|nr:MliC family protein [Povalibacter sp.]HMN43332.1 MliC family protein [Povalibacter sp.]
MRYIIALPVLSLLALTACERKQADNAAADSAAVPAANAGFDYTCTDGVKFNARIDRGNVVLTIDGKTLTLPPDTNTSGAHYSGEGVTFVASGRDATLIRDGENARSCSAP